jgi:hypothetical protein
MLQDKDGYRTALVFVCSLSYSGEQGTAGFITELALPFVHGRKADAERLVKHGFWEPCPGGWNIHDWANYQAAGEEAEMRKKRAQDAAYVRWHGRDGALCRRICASNAPSNAPRMPRAMRRMHMQRTYVRTD